MAAISDYPPEEKYDQTEFISFEGRLEQIYEEFTTLIELNFAVTKVPTWTEPRQVATEFGYKIVDDIYSFKQVDWDRPRLKWGFTKETMKVMDINEFNGQYLVADRESMNSIVNESFKSRTQYMTAVIAKMKLCGVTHIGPVSDELFFHISYDETCVSKVKKNSVSHIYLTPVIYGGIVVGNK